MRIAIVSTTPTNWWWMGDGCERCATDKIIIINTSLNIYSNGFLLLLLRCSNLAALGNGSDAPALQNDNRQEFRQENNNNSQRRWRRQRCQQFQRQWRRRRQLNEHLPSKPVIPFRTAQHARTHRMISREREKRAIVGGRCRHSNDLHRVAGQLIQGWLMAEHIFTVTILSRGGVEHSITMPTGIRLRKCEWQGEARFAFIYELCASHWQKPTSPFTMRPGWKYSKICRARDVVVHSGGKAIVAVTAVVALPWNMAYNFLIWEFPQALRLWSTRYWTEFFFVFGGMRWSECKVLRNSRNVSGIYCPRMRTYQEDIDKNWKRKMNIRYCVRLYSALFCFLLFTLWQHIILCPAISQMYVHWRAHNDDDDDDGDDDNTNDSGPFAFCQFITDAISSHLHWNVARRWKFTA